jgi:catalase
LDAASIPDGVAGVVLGDSAEQVVPRIQELLAAHRAWERFPAASA